ncbi:V-type ATP synthase subunit E protein [Marine Group I thaumarchaeote SCGC RSA3]|uniref:A-type ATP synthase subunit E n=2 Tax=Marine Group I TaxID=905826 RepID=A0A087RMA7_9ARCH|nr:V-type ATP synthase subunit E protein [Marine Group I thaumarchaeote SCGC AAA799-D11]KFM16198.1 V-type ATP synthase subunit E protein [Marine Group I thaumarchaeote SCGC RSA3]
MDERHPLASNSLEVTIDKILKNTENDVLSNIKTALDDSQQNLDDSVPKLEAEYDKILSDGKKEAEKIEKQIMGSADIEARNKQLMALEDAVDKVFSKALDQIANADRSGDYSNLIKTMIEEATQILGTSEITVTTNAKDKDVVQSTLSQFPGAEMSPDTIDCLGGIVVKSKDGAMTFDNTIDARIERLKPLIRKEIASKFGVGE